VGWGREAVLLRLKKAVFLGWWGASVSRAKAQATVFVPRVRNARATFRGGAIVVESVWRPREWALGTRFVGAKSGGFRGWDLSGPCRLLGGGGGRGDLQFQRSLKGQWLTVEVQCEADGQNVFAGSGVGRSGELQLPFTLAVRNGGVG